MTTYKPRSYKALLALASLTLLSTASQAADPIFFGPSAYLSAADIPVGFYLGGGPSLLETLEDGALDSTLNGNLGTLISSTFNGTRDSVDADDGLIDGNCGPQTSGRCVSWFNGNGGQGLSFSFVGAGPLPTAFALVWTDGGGTVTFSATGADGQSLGSIQAGGFADGSVAGSTGEDRFFGLQYAGGIRSIHISNSEGGIEVDHIQYGLMSNPVPEPGSWALMGLGLLGLLVRARRPAAQA